jgi:hypothetical protein
VRKYPLGTWARTEMLQVTVVSKHQIRRCLALATVRNQNVFVHIMIGSDANSPLQPSDQQPSLPLNVTSNIT